MERCKVQCKCDAIKPSAKMDKVSNFALKPMPFSYAFACGLGTFFRSET